MAPAAVLLVQKDKILNLPDLPNQKTKKTITIMENGAQNSDFMSPTSKLANSLEQACIDPLRDPRRRTYPTFDEAMEIAENRERTSKHQALKVIGKSQEARERVKSVADKEKLNKFRAAAHTGNDEAEESDREESDDEREEEEEEEEEAEQAPRTQAAANAFEPMEVEFTIKEKSTKQTPFRRFEQLKTDVERCNYIVSRMTSTSLRKIIGHIGQWEETDFEALNEQGKIREMIIVIQKKIRLIGGSAGSSTQFHRMKKVLLGLMAAEYKQIASARVDNVMDKLRRSLSEAELNLMFEILHRTQSTKLAGNAPLQSQNLDMAINNRVNDRKLLGQIMTKCAELWEFDLGMKQTPMQGSAAF